MRDVIFRITFPHTSVAFGCMHINYSLSRAGLSGLSTNAFQPS